MQAEHLLGVLVPLLKLLTAPNMDHPTYTNPILAVIHSALDLRAIAGQLAELSQDPAAAGPGFLRSKAGVKGMVSLSLILSTWGTLGARDSRPVTALSNANHATKDAGGSLLCDFLSSSLLHCLGRLVFGNFLITFSGRSCSGPTSNHALCETMQHDAFGAALPICCCCCLLLDLDAAVLYSLSSAYPQIGSMCCTL